MSGPTNRQVGQILLRIINNRDVNAVITALFCLLTVYTSFCSILEQNIFHPLVVEVPSKIKTIEIRLTFMSFVILWIISSAMGKLFNLLHFPFVFGSLLVGMIITNVPQFDVFYIHTTWEFAIRQIALVILISRWGICMNLLFIKSELDIISRLGFIPAIAETIAVTSAGYFIFCMPIGISILSGSLLSASSAPIIVPIMIDLTDKGLGTKKNLPKIIPSSLCVDTFVCLTIFIVGQNCVFTEDPVSTTLFRLAWKVLLGTLGGSLTGLLLWYFPKSSEGHTLFVRAFLIITCSITAIYGSFFYDCGYAGIVFVLCMTTISCLKWRQEDPMAMFPIEKSFLYIWNLLSCPLLFVLAGMKLKLSHLDGITIITIITLIALSALTRVITGVAVTSGVNYTKGERSIIILSMIPKATLQAALAPTLLVNAEAFPEYSNFLTVIVFTTLCAVLITAPVRMFLSRTAPSLLKVPDEQQPDKIAPDESTTTDHFHADADEQADCPTAMSADFFKSRASIREEVLRKRRESESFS